MVIHGTLHLIGYDHIKPEDTGKMERLEIKLLESLGFANPYYR
jgi:probable rRNA maturation factor